MRDVHDSIPAVEHITALYVDDADYHDVLRSALEDVDSFDVLTESEPTAALDGLDDVDCVVSELDLPTLDGFDVLSAVRDRHARLPFVLHTETPFDEVSDRLLEVSNAEYVQKDGEDGTVALLARRIRRLVERAQFRAATRRFAAAVDNCRDPTLIVGADGTIEYANGQLTSAVSPAHTDLCGREWTDLFTDEAAQQLQYDAIPVGTDGWTWSGNTVLEAGYGQELTARTNLVQLDDGSKVFVFNNLDTAPMECP